MKRSNGWQRSLTLIATDEFGDLAAIQETVYFPGGMYKPKSEHMHLH